MKHSSVFYALILACCTCLLSSCAKVMTVALDSQVDKPVYQYMQHISKKIEIIGITRYPDFKAMLSERDSIELALQISHAGKLESVRIIKPAKNPKLNATMLDIIEYSAPYPPLPDELKVDVIVIHKRWQFSPR